MAVEHPVRILDVTDGQNIDGKTVAFVSGSAFEIEFLHRTFITAVIRWISSGEKYVVGDIGGCSIKKLGGCGHHSQVDQSVTQLHMGAGL